MTAVTLPVTPLPLTVTPRLIDFGVDAIPPLGGVQQRVQRLGSRWAVDIEMPSMEGRYADQWIGARLEARALGVTVLFNWPQRTREAHGPTLVNGANQTGSTLAIDGVNGVIRAGRFFSVTVSGRSYLSCTTREVAPIAGAATLNIAPMLRASPADNAAVNFDIPIIEGFILGQTEEWTRDRLRFDTFKFTIGEVQ